MLRTVYLKTLRDERYSLLGWSIAVTLIITWVIAFWPALEDSMADFATLMDNDFFRALMGGADFATARGFLSAELFSFMLPVMIAVLAIGLGTAQIAGQEERGELTLVLVRPQPRWRIVIEKAAATLTMITLVVLVAFLVAVAGVGLADMDVDAGEIARAMLGLLLLGWFLAALALGLGAALGRGRIAGAATISIAVMFYLAATFAGLVDGLGWLDDISPWYWAFGDDAFTDGIKPLGAFGLLALTALAILAGTWRFQRRDLAA